MQNRKRYTWLGALAPAAMLLFTSESVATADTSFTAIGWPNALLSPGITATNALGQVFVRGNVHAARVQASDARFTGQVLIITDGAYNPDGTANVQGPSYLQVGSWDDAGTNFTPTAGLWIMTWHGVMQPDNSLQLSLAGYGSGGSIEGLRLEATLTRAAAASPVDPTVPYQYSGTIKAPAINTTQMLDDFNLPFTGSTWGRGTCSSAGGQFRAVGQFPIPTTSVLDSYVFGGRRSFRSVPDGQTLEWRADLVQLDDNATNTAILTVGSDTGAGYAFHNGRDFAYLLKWSSSFGMSILWCDRPALPLPNTNVIVSVALTRRQTDLIITTRVLDKANPGIVLFQHAVVDTPASDPTLTTAQFQALTGIRFLDLVPDATEAPPASVIAALGVFQNTDGQQPVPTAIWDNLELRTTEVPAMGIQPAVQLTWPDVGNYAVEAAPTVNGPWLPVQNSVIPGCQQMTVPQSGPMQFFRLQQAP
jgi:hypothetical protein